MKKLFLISAFLLAAAVCNAQSPVADPDSLKNPIKQIDPEMKTEPADIHYVDEMTRIAADELPPVVLDSLKKAEPAAWQKSVVYKSENEEIFLIHVREGGSEKTYRFNRDGRRLKNLDEEEKQ